MAKVLKTPIRCIAVVAAAGVLLAACGGGGGDVTTGGNPDTRVNPIPTAPATPEPTPAPILDGFGQPVQGMQPGDSGVDGTAAAGSAIVGASVTVLDAAGKSVSGVTDAQGYYRVRVTGFTPPLVARLMQADGRQLSSLGNQPLKVNGFITIDLTGLTDKVASDVARSGGQLRASDLTPKIVSERAAAIAGSVSQLRTDLAPVIAAAGLAANSFDPLAMPFRPDHKGYDYVLDNTSVTYAGDGATQVAIAAAFTLPGRWDLTIEGGRFGTAPDLAGAVVPRDAATAGDWCKNGYAQAVRAVAIPLSGVPIADPPPCSQNSFTIVADGRSDTYAFDFGSYQGCGSCEAGSRVVVTYRVSYRSRLVPTPIPFTDRSDQYVATYSYLRRE